MSLNDIFELGMEGIKWFCIGLSGYYISFGGLNSSYRLFSEKIDSEEDFNKIVEEETKKLEFDKKFNKTFYKEKNIARAEINKKDGNYEIQIGGSKATRAHVRHELYHIKRGHLDQNAKLSEFSRGFYYWFKFEPQASVYGAFRIKL